MRLKAQKAGVSAKLDAGCFEVMETANAMHNACVAEAETGRVERCFRKAAWLAYEPGEKKLQKAEGDRWDGLPLGGSNLSVSYLEERFSGLDSEGVPKRPDWSELHKLRLKQTQDAELKKASKKQGSQKAVINS